MRQRILRTGSMLTILVLWIAVSLPSAIAAPITKTFNSLAELDIANGLGPGTAGTFGPAAFEITNNTGDLWTDFHLRLSWLSPSGLLGGINYLYFNDYTGPGSATLYNPLGGTNPYTLSNIDVNGLGIADGTTLDFSISGGWLGENLPTTGYFWVYAYPTTVPEPSTILLVGLGAAGLGFLRRRREPRKV